MISIHILAIGRSAHLHIEACFSMNRYHLPPLALNVPDGQVQQLGDGLIDASDLVDRLHIAGYAATVLPETQVESVLSSGARCCHNMTLRVCPKRTPMAESVLALRQWSDDALSCSTI